MAERVAQTLAYSETQGGGWMRGALLFIDLLPHSRGTSTGAELRVVLRAGDADANRMLGVDRWVVVQTPQMSAENLSRRKVPAWVLTESGSEDGPARSNLACAKHLAELLLLLVDEMARIAASDLFAQTLCFNRNLASAKTQEPLAPPLTDAQCLGLMELADAWRDHIWSTWRAFPNTPTLERIWPMRMSPLTEQVLGQGLPPPPPPPPRLDPEEFPALGHSPRRARPRASQCVPRVRLDVAEAVGKVAWIGVPECNEGIWLRGGPLPHKINW